MIAQRFKRWVDTCREGEPLPGRQNDMHKSFDEMGIPKGYGFKRLLFCAPANTLVVEIEALSHWRPARLYSRASGVERYEPIGTPSELLSQEDPAVSLSHPLLAYNTLRNSFTIDAEGNELHSGNWEAIRVCDLSAGKEVHVVDRETLHLPDRNTEVWIPHLLSFTPNPETLHVVAAFRRDQPHVNYYVSELHLPTGLVRPITSLPAAFL